jgi:outer membrane protein with beta-barrel domain
LNRSFFVAALAGVALVSFEARAQIVKPGSVQFGVAAGVSLPVSDLSDIANTGFNGTVTLGFQPTMIPLGVRIDGAYNQWGVKSAFGSGNFHSTSVTGNLVFKMPGATVSPYAIGGAGWYNLGASGGGSSENDFGWNIGGGISMALSGFDTFLEARFNQIQTDVTPTRFIPITFGVMFGF